MSKRMSKQDNLYVSEMQLWIKEQSARLNQYENGIKNSNVQIAFWKKQLQIEQQQLRVIQKRIKLAKDELREFLKNKELNQ